MNASAKVTAVLLACAALGTAVFSGCTVNSTSNNDTDGGSTSGSTSGSSGSTSGTVSNDVDSGPTGTGIPVGTGCADNTQPQNSGFVSVECQTCLEQKCCTELKTCFSLVGDNDKVGCDDYSTCVSQCNDEAVAEADGGDPDPTTCITERCDPAAADGVSAKYNDIITCGEQEANCKTACNL